MKKLFAMVTISLLCVSVYSVLTPRVMGWASSLPRTLHEDMAYDALRNSGWSVVDAAQIAFNAWGGVTSFPIEEYTDYYHRLNEYQTELHNWHIALGEDCQCDDQGNNGGAEDGAYHYIQQARTLYASGSKAEALENLGYAIHFIQDSVCPPHVFPFSEHITHAAASDFEFYTANEYYSLLNDWDSRVENAIEELIWSAEDLRQKVIDAAHEERSKFEPPPSGFGYVREDGTTIGDLSWTLRGWKMSSEDIGWCMEKAASLVKGAAKFVRSPTPQLDVYMLVDLTGSFSDDLPRFKAQAPSIIANLKASNPNTRFGLGKFEDYPIHPFGDASSGDRAYVRIIDLTFDTNAVLSSISSLFTRYGEDAPESQLTALYQAATGAGQDLSGVGFPGASIPPGQQANFRDGATKLFILWTDSSFHNPGDPGTIPYPGPSFDETVAAIKNLDPPMVIGISSGSGGVTDLRRIAVATGALAPAGGVDTNGDGTIDILEGEPLVCAISSSGYGIAEAIEALVGAAAVLPIANANGPYEGEVGKALILDGSGSFDTDGYITLYEWDFEGDGVFDFSSTESTTSHTYETAVSGVVALRVTDNDGNTDTDEAAITIVQGDTTPPETWLVFGDPKFLIDETTFLTSATSITFLADDNPDGTGVASTFYRVYHSSYDTGWLEYSAPFYLTGLTDGEYSIDYYSIDNAGNTEPTQTISVTLDNSGPLITIENPPAGWALQDGVTFIALSTDPSGTHSLNFSIREANGGQGIPVGFEDMPATYNAVTGKWEWFFNTLQLPDGFYIVLVNADDNLGHTASITVPYSIRNWAVLELLPASENNKAGRTMPVKFALRVAASVDPSQPFVYNEELTIKIYATDNPSNILQTSTFGDTARDYRINTLSEQYITNFQTLKTPKAYKVEVWRKDMLIDAFGFQTFK